MNEFLVSIDAFQGPLDLMLHLISEHKLNLQDLDMSVLASQYIAYIQSMQSMKLEIASEYLTELAGLVEYKSRMLLPRSEENLEDAYEEDPRDALVARLLEYQQYKEAGQDLSERRQRRLQHFDRNPSDLIQEWSQPVESMEHLSVYELSKAMQRVLRRQAVLSPYETKMQTRRISTQQRRMELEAMLEKRDSFTFDELLEDCQDVHMIIVTFLALLEMVHMCTARARQDEEGTIYIRKGESHGELEPNA